MGWRRLHNEELHKLYPSPNTGRVIKSRAEHVGCIVETRYTNKILGGSLGRKRPFGRPRLRLNLR
jgi:hypothetical protein